MVDQFVFGYGSLILSPSRAQTIGDPGIAMPMRVRGVRREWSLAAPQYGLTAVSLRAEEDGVCSGVVFPVNNEQLATLDQREEGYDRIQLENTAITSLQHGVDIPSPAIVWTYVANMQGMPTPVCPIVQSYLDVILTGCLDEFSEGFAKEFIVTTAGWSENWVNDRAHPRYPRPLKEVPHASTIDRILSAIVPHAFSHRLSPD